MTEEEARGWISGNFGEAAVRRLEYYAALLAVEADQQNLISASTIPALWSRHLADSAQLALLADPAGRAWVDIGSGAGLPGLVIAAITEWPVVLIEPRRLRAEFLANCAIELGFDARVSVVQAKAESAQIGAAAGVISARAVAALPDLLKLSTHLADAATIWVLPKGSRAQSEVADAKRSWQGVFHVKQSVVDPDSGIVVASQLSRRR